MIINKLKEVCPHHVGVNRQIQRPDEDFSLFQLSAQTRVLQTEVIRRWSAISPFAQAK